MNHGRQLRLFLSDGTSSGPRFYEIVNRTIQSLGIPATRIKELVSTDWPEFQKPGVYLVHGTTMEAEERLYIGKGENVAKRVQGHPDKLDFEVTSILVFSSKDENLNASQIGWLESSLIRAAMLAKRISTTNVQTPELPTLSRAEIATIAEFYEDLKLIAQTAGYDFFSSPKSSAPSTTTSTGLATNSGTTPEFQLNQPKKNLTARGYLSDEGFVVKAGSDASAATAASFKGGYSALRENLIKTGVLIPKSGQPDLLTFAIDYAFSASSAASSTILGTSSSGNIAWKYGNQMLGQYLEALSPPVADPTPLPTGSYPPPSSSDP